MDIFMEFVNKTNKSAKPNKGIVMMMENLACSTSTIGMMQEFDEQLFNSIEKFLKGDQNCDLLSGIQNIEKESQEQISNSDENTRGRRRHWWSLGRVI